jgi:dienelactone hydrolase
VTFIFDDEAPATAVPLPDGDEDAWRATAVRTARLGEEALEAGDLVGAREAFLRTSDQYRAAAACRREGSPNDPAVVGLSRCARDYFCKAGELLDGPFAEVSIPYGDGEMPGYLFLVDDSGTARPTVVYTGGVDSTCEEGYALIGAAALKGGYHFLAYDGPGQGSMVHEKRIPFRPDWENVLGPVVDYALSVPEIDGDKLVQFGSGLGGHLVARHAVHDHRSAAVIHNGGMTTFYASWPQLPEAILELIEEEHDDEAAALLEALVKEDPGVRSRLRNGRWSFGARSTADYVRKTAEYTLTANDVREIRTPVLVLEAEDDTAFAGQASNFARAMTAPVHHVVLRRAAAAGRHRHEVASVLHRAVFDFLAKIR